MDDTGGDEANWDEPARSDASLDSVRSAVARHDVVDEDAQSLGDVHSSDAFVYTGTDAVNSSPRLRAIADSSVNEQQPDADAVDGLNSLNTPIKHDTAGINGFKRKINQAHDSPTLSGRSSPSNDTFPIYRARPTVFELGPGPLSSRRPSVHPQISRLRSMSTQQRFASNSSYSTALEFPLGGAESPSTSPFDVGSRRSSASNIFDIANGNSSQLATPHDSSPAATERGVSRHEEIFKWSLLKRVSSKVHPPASKAAAGAGGAAGGVGVTTIGSTRAGVLGTPTVMAVSGVIAVGTSKGWTMVFDFNQNLRCVCGTEAISRDCGPVTALAISQDHTFIAVGHALGAIHLFALSQPAKPARSVSPTSLQLVMTGRQEGHLAGARILHLSFVGARHTAIVSSDDAGLAFYHSLGRVLMLASTDIIRMLGQYPDSAALDSSNAASPLPRTKKPSTIFDMAALPLGPGSHPSDSHSLIALITPTKLVVVGLKPKPRTWWRAMPRKDNFDTRRNQGQDFAQMGVLTWLPSVARETDAAGRGGEEKLVPPGDDPLLAFAWGRRVRIVRVGRVASQQQNASADVSFTEEAELVCDRDVLALKWYSADFILILTDSSIEMWRTSTGQRIGREDSSLGSLVGHDLYGRSLRPHGVTDLIPSYAASFQIHKKKLFLLGTADVRVGALMSWADRILGLMHSRTILDAIELATAYLQGQTDASTIALPDDPTERRMAIEPRVREILNASVAFVFSDDRLRDGTHANGEAIQRLFEGLVGTCVRASLAIGDADWLFDELYERYEQNGIESIFLERLEPFVLSGSVHALPPSVSQRLIAIHEKRGQYAAAERIIWHVDPENIDVDQALRLCQREKLYDALFYVYTRCIHDFVAPIVDMLGLIREVLIGRSTRPTRIGDGDVESSAEAIWGSRDVEALVPDAYKIFQYLSSVLCGRGYPKGDELPYGESIKARTAVYNFVFSPRTLASTSNSDKLIRTTVEDVNDEPSFPYIRLLLTFDSEHTLDTLDLAFEDSYLDDDFADKTIDRQKVVDLLLSFVGDDAALFSPLDRTFIRIFVARNLPKYPQYIKVRDELKWLILRGLASDTDQSTIDDRQLAVEFLLSVYTPPDLDALVSLLQRARFHRLLRSVYRGNKRWAELAKTYLEDDAADVFRHLSEVLRLASSESRASVAQGVMDVVLEAVPTLVQATEDGLHQLALLVQTRMPDQHGSVIERLSSSSWRQFAYLRYLLEPAFAEGGAATDQFSDVKLDRSQRLHYLSLLCEHEPLHVIRYLESADGALATADDARAICEQAGVFDAVVWSLDQDGDVRAALDKMDEALDSRTDLILDELVRSKRSGEGNSDEEGDEQTVASVSETVLLVDQVAAVTRASIDVCSRRTADAQSRTTLSSEELWFRLLSSIISVVRAVRGVAASGDLASADHSSSRRRVSGASIVFREVDDDRSAADHAVQTLSSLLPLALSSLVSTVTTRQVPFPRLMRRLIDANARSPATNGSYAEFKAIVTTMLDSFVSEADLLDITSKLTSQDLFEFVDQLKRTKDSGWRAGSDVCEECLQPVWGPRGQGSPPMSRSASVSMVVDAMGISSRPNMQKRPSIKGKEVEWPAPLQERRRTPLEPPKGVIVGQDGRLWHQACHLSSFQRM
ncbi:hypothetical protein ACM66B_000349 [Microbotryomycetes sp. NB124-2]